MAEQTPDDLFHISQLIDQLRHDDSQLRVNAAKNVTKIGIYAYFVVVMFRFEIFYVASPRPWTQSNPR